jgi:uncharacterized membrane protein (UPF0127 family)
MAPIRVLTSLALLLSLALAAPAFADDATLVIRAQNGEHTFTVEIADTPADRSRGLMFRESLAPDAGMLFDFHEERPVSFWMQNTLIPLDMLFIRADGHIANVHAEAKPRDTTSIPSDGPVAFVLEIPGGRAAELGIAAGDLVIHDRIPLKP